MLGPAMAALSAPPSLSLAAFAPNFAGGHAGGRGGASAQVSGGDKLALCGVRA